jgi:hypothetical protein
MVSVARRALAVLAILVGLVAAIDTAEAQGNPQGSAWGEISWGDGPDRVTQKVPNAHAGNREPRGVGPNASYQLVAVDHYQLYDGYFAIKFYFRNEALDYIAFVPEELTSIDYGELYNQIFMSVMGRFGQPTPLNFGPSDKIVSDFAWGGGGSFARLTRFRGPPRFILLYGGAYAGGL